MTPAVTPVIFSVFQTQRRGSNQDAKDLMALVDLYTEIQQEMIEGIEQDDTNKYARN